MVQPIIKKFINNKILKNLELNSICKIKMNHYNNNKILSIDHCEKQGHNLLHLHNFQQIHKLKIKNTIITKIKF